MGIVFYLPGGFEDDEAARAAMAARDLAHREEMKEMKKKLKGLEEKVALHNEQEILANNIAYV